MRRRFYHSLPLSMSSHRPRMYADAPSFIVFYSMHFSKKFADFFLVDKNLLI